MRPVLRALSLQQPFATPLVGFWRLTMADPPVLVEGPKDIENRSRLLFHVDDTSPGWIAIHASLGRYGDEGTLERVRALWPELPPVEALPRGAIIGAVRFDWVAVIEATDSQPRLLRSPGQPGLAESKAASRAAILASSGWTMGPVCYHVAERRVLLRPVPCAGSRGLWRVPDPLVDGLLEAIPELANGPIRPSRVAPAVEVPVVAANPRRPREFDPDNTGSGP